MARGYTVTNELPKILQGKLEFGNREQIDALKEYYDKLEKNEENIEAGLKKFKVKQGPILGKMLAAILDGYLDNPKLTKAQAFDIAQKLLEKINTVI